MLPFRKSAFTLIEMLIVLSLVGIFAAMLMPTFEPAMHDQLQAVAQIVVADLDYARSLAVAHNSNYRITFDPNRNRYILEHTGSNSSLDTLPAHPFHTGESDSRRHVIVLDDLPRMGGRVRLLAVAQVGASVVRTNHVEFGPVGATTASSDTVIWLAAGSGTNRRFLAVRVHPITGLATIDPFDAVGPPASAMPVSSVSPTRISNTAQAAARLQETHVQNG